MNMIIFAQGLYTDFTSFTPFSYKIGLSKTLVHRAYREKQTIKNLLVKNLYPSYFVDKEIKKKFREQIHY